MQKVNKSGVETEVVSGVRVESRVKSELDSGLKLGAKIGKMGQVGRRELGRQVKCKEVDTGVELARFCGGSCTPLNEACAFCWHVPSFLLFYPTLVLDRAG